MGVGGLHESKKTLKFCTSFVFLVFVKKGFFSGILKVGCAKIVSILTTSSNVGVHFGVFNVPKESISSDGGLFKCFYNANFKKS